MTYIFISYRRHDSRWATGRLYDHLCARFGDDKIFMDVDTIQPGEDFVEAIENAIGRCSALIAVIGEQWLSEVGPAGDRWIDDPSDFVRLEIASALKRNITVIPALLDNSLMPRAEALPDNLKNLVRRQAIKISNERFRYDMAQLIKVLERILNLSSKIVVSGYWTDTTGEFGAYFGQQGERVAGFYALNGVKTGTYWGTVEDNKCELNWKWIDNSLEGKALVKAANDAVNLTLDYWLSEEPLITSHVAFHYVSDNEPTWLNDTDMETLEQLLAGKVHPE